MDMESLKNLLASIASGELSVENASQTLAHFSLEDIDYAHIDHHRSLRKGFPEVVFGQGKTADQIIGIIESMKRQENTILVTRIKEQKADKILSIFPDISYDKDARMLIWEKKEPIISGRGTILVLSAGTSDIPVAKEAYLTAKAMGNQVETVFDVGVAGLHRLFDHKKLIDQATVLIVVAGMEGALPSVVAERRRYMDSRRNDNGLLQAAPIRVCAFCRSMV